MDLHGFEFHQGHQDHCLPYLGLTLMHLNHCQPSRHSLPLVSFTLGAIFVTSPSGLSAPKMWKKKLWGLGFNPYIRVLKSVHPSYHLGQTMFFNRQTISNSIRPCFALYKTNEQWVWKVSFQSLHQDFKHTLLKWWKFFDTGPIACDSMCNNTYQICFTKN